MSKEEKGQEELLDELEWLRQENTHLKAQLRVRDMLGPSDDHILVIDWEGKVHHCAQTAKPQTVYLEKAGFEKHNLFHHLDPEFHEALHNAMLELALGAKPSLVEYAITVNRQQAWFETQLNAFEIDDLKLITLTSRDITRRTRLRLSLSHNAWHDALTKLPNRLLFEQQAKEAIEIADETGKALTILIFDIEQLRDINKEHGQHIGNAILKHVGTRLSRLLRHSDVVARIGGDEFAALLPDLGEGEGKNRVLAKIIERFETPIHLDTHKILVQLTIGCAVYPEDAQCFNDLIKIATAVLAQVKQAAPKTSDIPSSETRH